MANFDATKGGPAANSYATTDEADDFFELDYTAGEWTNLDDDTKEKLLVTAARQIDRLKVKHDKLSAAQALKFPVDAGQEDGFAQAKEACIRQALYIFINQDNVDEARAGMIQGVKGESIGPVGKTMTGFNPFAQWAPGVLTLLADFVDLKMRSQRG